MANAPIKFLVAILAFSYGLLNFCLYAFIAIWQGTFFQRPTEKEVLEFELGISTITYPFVSVNKYADQAIATTQKLEIDSGTSPKNG